MDPASLVISTSETPADVPGASVTVTAVIASVPPPVWKVNASAIVAAPPGAMVALAGSMPLPSVVRFGVTGEPVGTAPIA